MRDRLVKDINRTAGTKLSHLDCKVKEQKRFIGCMIAYSVKVRALSEVLYLTRYAFREKPAIVLYKSNNTQGTGIS